MRAELESFIQDEQGQGLVEYALIIALVIRPQGIFGRAKAP